MTAASSGAVDATRAENTAGSSSAVEHAPPEAQECPICMESIDPEAATMRCQGRAGQHHYVHQVRIAVNQRLAQSAGAACNLQRNASMPSSTAKMHRILIPETEVSSVAWQGKSGVKKNGLM
eukprot:TRINITY_DN8363_c0_g1_i2.p1 TRINITY_DN8363_c0_g1~~TRINITY_DN8363_c0_g1_i2.p1  ORF type:complete len:122 (-),score=18.58 TRINITY_DN8363_c0_g1_i2:195-560(-)